jgi:hypothetical protein
MRRALPAALMIVVFLFTMIQGAPPQVPESRYADGISSSGEYTTSDWPGSNGGTGSALPTTIRGLKTSSGTAVIDYTHPGYVGADVPAGWTLGQTDADLSHLSRWVDAGLVNPNLDDVHTEKFFVAETYPEDNGDSVDVPDGWTIVKTETDGSGSGRESHPEHGIFELNTEDYGYDNSEGWEFDAQWGGSDTLYSGDGVYISQQVGCPYRDVYSAELVFLYKVSGSDPDISDMENQTYVFARIGGYEVKLMVFEPGDTVDAWLRGEVTVPSSAFENLAKPMSLLVDIGLGTDLSGQQGTAQESYVWIDEIGLRFLVRPFPEEIDLSANGLRVSGSTQGTVSPYVPDGANRDCYSAPDSNGGSGGVDLDGPSGNGWLEVGADVPLYPDWSTAFSYQVGIQFPLYVPQGAAVTSAILQVEAVSDSTGYPGMRIYVADEDNVAAFTSGYPLLPDRYDWVNTSVYWRPTTWSANGRYSTPELADLIQEVVARPGWQSGNYICVMIDYAYSNQQYAYNQIKGSTGFLQGDLARLQVNFVTPSGDDTIANLRYGKSITIDHTKVASSLEDFPVLIDIWDQDLRTRAQADGDDIAFFMDGQYLSHELELFNKNGNGTHAHLVAWVRIPFLSSTTDTQFSMFYGDEDAGRLERPEEVWASDYEGVWHMSESPAQPQWSATYSDYLPHAPQMVDSAYPYDYGTSSGSMTASDLVGGAIANAISFDGTDDRLTIGDPSDGHLDFGTSSFSFSLWINWPLTSSYQDALYKGARESGVAGYIIYRRYEASGGTASVSVGDGSSRYQNDFAIPSDTWIYIVGVVDRSTNRLRAYLNGVEQGSGTDISSLGSVSSTQSLLIGDGYDNAASIIDEVRISRAFRSAGWILTEFTNQEDPEGFSAVGEERNLVSEIFSFKKDIVIDHTKVTSDVAGFPLLVDIYDSDLHADVQPDADDIIFMQGGNILPHEIEVFDQDYNGTHAHLAAWVRTDLSSTYDTTITLYYGDPDVASQENPAEVWGADYRGIWHFAETSGDALDSTSYGTDGSVPAPVNRGVSGQIGSAYGFDGQFMGQQIDMADPADGHLDFGTSSFSVSFWVNFDQSTGDYQLPFWKGGNTVGNAGYEFETNQAGTNFGMQISDGSTHMTTTDVGVDLDSWMYIVGVVDRSANRLRIYKNGFEVGSGTDISTVGSLNNGFDLRICWDWYTIDGMLDEVRVIPRAVSAAWIEMEYYNQNDPAGFYNVGPGEAIASAEFAYTKDIVVDHTRVQEDLTDFPLLIDIFDTDLRTKVQSDGDDIIFGSSGIQLPHEIELFDMTYNGTHAHLVAWVRTNLSSTTDTIVTMYYGSPGATNQEDPNSVWDDSYMGVWHLSEPSGNAQDSTSYQTWGTPSGLLTQGAAGRIGNAYSFDRDGVGTVSMGDPADGHLDFGGTDDFTIEFWVNLDYFYYYEPFIVSKRNGLSSSDQGYAAFASDDNNGYAGYSVSSDGPQFGVDASTPLLDTGWRHVVYVFDQDSDTISTIFVDGVDDKSSSWGTIGSVGSLQNSANFRLNGHSSPSNEDMFDGMLDEVRISRAARSAGWILTEFNNQNDPASFYNVGPEKALASVEFAYSKDIVVNHAEVEEDLTGFPLLIDIFDTDLRTKVQSDGDDIVFEASGMQLPHEIELFDQEYNSTHAHLVAWVRLDLSSTTDTAVTMHYGDATAVNQEDPGGVWDDNYLGVWHMGENSGGSGAIRDSTSQDNDGTDYGTPSFGVTGAIGDAIYLDDGPYIEIPDSPSLDSITTGITISVWTNADPYIWESPVIVKGGEDSGAFSLFFYRSSDTNDICYYLDGVSGGTQYTGESVTRNGWMHVVLTYDGSYVRVYKNGTLESTQPISLAPSIVGNNEPLYIGYESDYADYYLGAIDEARLSGSAKSAGWILTEYRNQHAPSSFYSVQPEEQTGSNGYVFTTNSTSSVTVGVDLSLGVYKQTYSLTEDLVLGTSFSIENGTLPVWTANVLVSPPPELDAVSFEVSYCDSEWFPTSVWSPSNVEKVFSDDWTCFDGLLVVGSEAVDQSGVWRIQFLDRNHALDMMMGVAGGPYSSSQDFAIGQDIEFQIWSSAPAGSTVSLELADPTGTTWYSGSTVFQGTRFALPYYHRKSLTISQDNVVGNLVDFPVLIDLYDTDLRTDVRPDGRDIAFAIGETALAYEVELFEPSYNLTHAHLLAWVKVPVLSASSDTVIDVYYGNPLAPVTYSSGPVWDAGYLGIWHLSESGTGAPDEYLDSSLYGNDAQGGEGNASFVPTRVSGKIGAAQDFNNLDGYYDLIDCGDSPLWDIDGYQITLEAWIQHDITPNTHVYGILNHKGWYDGYSLYINYGGGSTIKPTFSLPGETNQLVGANDVTGGTWHQVVAVYDGALMRIFVDGIQDPNVMVKTDAIEPSSMEKGLWIGHGDQPKDKVWSAEWDGQIDEVRISNVARSTNWVATQFQNQDDPNSFYAVGVEESPGYFKSSSITLDTSAGAGVWHAVAHYSDDGTEVDHRTGIFERSYVVKRAASLSLAAPGDAVSDGISTRLVGEQLYVEYEMSDELSSETIAGATISLNWSVSSVPTIIQLHDYGDGRYGRALNTSDLGAFGRWRVDVSTEHPFYAETSDVFYVDLSHRTFMTYEPPAETPYGDDFQVRVTLSDQYDGSPLAGATFACNGTIVGTPIDFGNGTYLVTIDSMGLEAGSHAFRLSATPSTSYLMSSSIDIEMEYRPIASDAYLLSPDSVEAPWGQQATTQLHWFDLDHFGVGIGSGTIVIDPFVHLQTTDLTGGYYNVTIDISSFSTGTYVFMLTISRTNYEDATLYVTVVVREHRTSLGPEYDEIVPVGSEAEFDISVLDIDSDSAPITAGNLSRLVVDWGGGFEEFYALSFILDTRGWNVGIYTINITMEAIEGPSYYADSFVLVELEIRKLNVFLSWDHLEPFPNGNDFSIYLHVNVSEPGIPMDGTPIDWLDQSYFSATNETGASYSIKSFTSIGGGLYEITIDGAVFLEGEYRITVFVDFQSSQNYTDTHTPLIAFTYRPILTYLSSPDYPTVATSFDTNVTITLSYVDIDHLQNITTASVSAEGVSIVWQNMGDGIYEVLLIIQGWDLGIHEVNITADAASYQAKTLTFQVLVQIAYAYARSSTTTIDLPVGDSAVLYADYWDITHDVAITGATVDSDWLRGLIVSWTGTQYRIEIPSFDADTLGTYTVMFNFSKGANYQFGYFNVTVTLRTHSTDFRLASAVAPTSYNAMVNISVYLGDLDNDAGVSSSSVSFSVFGDSGMISSYYENDTAQGSGYYTIQIAASNLGVSGVYELTIHFNWTGAVQKFYDGAVKAYVSIVGEASKLTLLDSSGPTAYLENLTYTYVYSELYSGVGISNATEPAGNVFIYVAFPGHSVDLSMIVMREMPGYPGYYVIEFNSTLLGTLGTYPMVVHVNWSSGIEPYYGNHTDTVTVRITARSTTLDLIPPESVSYGLNTTFSFSFEDLGGSVSIPWDPRMLVTIGLPDYSLFYNDSTRQFQISFNTSILGEPLGSRQFVIGISWGGAPFYANVTSRTVTVDIRPRETEFNLAAVSPIAYGDNVSLSMTYMDTTTGVEVPVSDGVVTLYNGSQEIPAYTYSTAYMGNGEYTVVMNTSYFARPGTYSLRAYVSTSHFYYAETTVTRALSIRYRQTILIAEPVDETPYNSTLQIVLTYSDILSLSEIANGTYPVTIEIVNGSSWLFTSTYRAASRDYLVIVETYNQDLEIGREYLLLVRMSYSDAPPFYLPAETYVSFTLTERMTLLDLIETPLPTQYGELVNLTVFYLDTTSAEGISGATIALSVDGLELLEGVDYILTETSVGIYAVAINTTSIGPATTTASLLVEASWSIGAPFYAGSSLTLTVSVTQRAAIIQVAVQPSQVKFLENVTFVLKYVDEQSQELISLTKQQILVYSGGFLLGTSDFSFAFTGTGYQISINSTTLSSGLVSNWNVSVIVDWQDATAPYYTDDMTSVWVSVVERTGLIVRGPAPTTPIGNNMTITFSYTDTSTGTGINDAIVIFDCLSPSGLVENTDFWISRIAGQYTILVDTGSLGGTGTFTFSLRLLWDPDTAPYYRNSSTIYMQGAVRLIQAQLENDDPTPSPVPLNENVSVTIAFTDLDHGIPIVGAASAFQVVYKTNVSGPGTWSITALGPGLYELVVDCSDVGVTGTDTLIVTISYLNYQTVEVQIPFQIRLRQGELNESTSPSTYYGETTFVLVSLTDIDDDGAPMSDALLDLDWPGADAPVWSPLGGGLYNISLTTSGLDAGLYTLVIGAQKTDYFIPEISVPVQVLRIPTQLILPQSVPDVYWGESLEIWALFNDTLHDSLVSGATVVYQFGVLSGPLIEGTPSGNYSFAFDTGSLAIATAYVVSITATYDNHMTVTGQVTVNVLRLPIELTTISSINPEEFKGDDINVTVFVNDTLNGVPLLGATVRATWLTAQGTSEMTLTSVPGMAGYYSGMISTDDLLVGDYVITVSAGRTNYVTATTSVTAKVKQIPTDLWLDSETLTYSSRTFNWSDTVRIGVYVVAPSLNESHPYATGLSDCIVMWSLSGTSYSGQFENGSAIGGAGFYYFDFETWAFDASTYTLRITAYPNVGMFASSSNSTTLRINPVATSVESTYIEPRIWGWCGWVNLTYWDMLHDAGVHYADVILDWEGLENTYLYLGEGVYQIFLNTSLVSPGVYPVSVNFLKDNYEGGTGVFTLTVQEVPTDINVFAPYVNQIDGSPLDLQIPYGDTLTVTLFYNDTWYNRGIAGATLITAVIIGPTITYEETIPILELDSGNYTIQIDTTRWSVNAAPYRVIVSIQLNNWSRATADLDVTIIDVPTGLSVEGPSSVLMSYGQISTIWVFYYDDWPGHEGQGVPGASINATSLDTSYVVVSLNRSDSSRPGWYEIRLRSNRMQGSTVVTIELSRANYASSVVTVGVEVEPSDFDILLERTLILGVPIGLIFLAGAILWTRLFSVPKMLRHLRKMVKDTAGGKIPKPPENLKSRREIVAALFNEIAEPLGITRTAENMPQEPIPTEVPEIEELLLQLSILTKVTPDELEDFKRDVSKMKLSEQVAFVREVITQEAIKRARSEGTTMEAVLAETAAQARALVSGVAPAITAEPPVEVEELGAIPPQEEETILPQEEALIEEEAADLLSDGEVEEIRQKLKAAGVGEAELKTIIEQVRELPRDLADELLRSVLGEGGDA